MKSSVEFMGPGYMWRALENNVPEIKEQIEVLKPCSDRKSVVVDVPSIHAKAFEEYWSDVGGSNGITVEKVSQLPELPERQRFGQMERRPHFGERYSQGRDVFQRYGKGQFSSRNGYGGKASFKKDFKSSNSYGQRRNNFANSNGNFHRFDSWLE